MGKEIEFVIAGDRYQFDETDTLFSIYKNGDPFFKSFLEDKENIIRACKKEILWRLQSDKQFCLEQVNRLPLIEEAINNQDEWFKL